MKYINVEFLYLMDRFEINLFRKEEVESNEKKIRAVVKELFAIKEENPDIKIFTNISKDDVEYSQELLFSNDKDHKKIETFDFVYHETNTFIFTYNKQEKNFFGKHKTQDFYFSSQNDMISFFNHKDNFFYKLKMNYSGSYMHLVFENDKIKEEVYVSRENEPREKNTAQSKEVTFKNSNNLVLFKENYTLIAKFDNSFVETVAYKDNQVKEFTFNKKYKTFFDKNSVQTEDNAIISEQDYLQAIPRIKEFFELEQLVNDKKIDILNFDEMYKIINLKKDDAVLIHNINTVCKSKNELHFLLLDEKHTSLKGKTHFKHLSVYEVDFKKAPLIVDILENINKQLKPKNLLEVSNKPKNKLS